MNTYFGLILFGLLVLTGGFQSARNSQRPAWPEAASKEATLYFEKGLLLLHNFEYADAAEEFVRAQQKDPDFIMAYWGEAMTYDHPIWRDLDVEKSRAALKKIGQSPAERMAKAKTALERDFMQGVEILFGEGSKPDREKAYSDHMGKLYTKYPDNHDVAAFYALSLLALKNGWSEWEEYNVKAARIVSAILRKAPDHPGALHYLVHADDHPQYAREGLAAADRYAKVASYAGHALHMPSHIYLALGMWNDVVRSNEVSWQAGVDRKQRKGLTNDQLNYHAHLWLSYGYLQQGRFQRAKELIDNQVKYTVALPSAPARYHLMAMKGHYLFQTGSWNSTVAEIPIKTEGLDVGAQYTNSFLEGYKLFKQANAGGLSNHIDEFDKALAKSALRQQASEGMAICGVTRYTDAAPTMQEIRLATRYAKELKGLLAWLQKDMVAAEGLFKDALPKEGSVVVGPPVFLISPYELYGDFLLATHRPSEAFQQYAKALAASPNRYIALKGQLQSAKALQDKEIETNVRKQLQQNLKEADAIARDGVW